MLRKFITTTLMAAAITAVPAQAETKLLFNVFVPPGHFMHEVLKGWAQDVEKVTESRVDIEFAAGSLAPPPQQLQGVASGVFDVAFAINPTIKSKAPLLEVSSLPWLVSDAEAASVAAWRIYEKHFASRNQFPDVHLLSVFNFSGGQLYSTTDTPINSLDELKSRKMWALYGESADLLKNLGISPITSPAVQVSESVSRGVVNGYFGLILESVIDFKTAPYTKSITLFPLGVTSSGFSMFINKRKWGSISEARCSSAPSSGASCTLSRFMSTASRPSISSSARASSSIRKGTPPVAERVALTPCSPSRPQPRPRPTRPSRGTPGRETCRAP